MCLFEEEFQRIQKSLEPTESHHRSLMIVRDMLRRHIRRSFIRELKLPPPKFMNLGAWAIETPINHQNGMLATLDDGIFLRHLDSRDLKAWPQPDLMFQWIRKAIQDHTRWEATDGGNCLQMVYNNYFSVDFFVFAGGKELVFIAETMPAGWRHTRGHELSAWIRQCVRRKGPQLLRVIRLLKAWANAREDFLCQRPCGLLLTILGGQNFCPDQRDELSLTRTAHAISNSVHPVLKVTNPLNSAEDFSERLTSRQISIFQKALSHLAKKTTSAVVSKDDPHKARSIWRSLLGNRFP